MAYNGPSSKVGENLRRYRLAARLNYLQLSKLSGVSNVQIRDIEKGKSQNVTIKTLEQLSQALDVSITELLSLPTLEELSAQGVPIHVVSELARYRNGLTPADYEEMLELARRRYLANQTDHTVGVGVEEDESGKSQAVGFRLELNQVRVVAEVPPPYSPHVLGGEGEAANDQPISDKRVG
jgi:transcriptional regulator with XRE-family HTH domain